MGNVVIINEIKDLGFVDIAGVCEGVKNAVRVQSVVLAVAHEKAFLRVSADGMFAEGSQRREELLLTAIQGLP